VSVSPGSHASLTIDRVSLLAEVDARMRVAACEAALRTEGLTLALVTLDPARAESLRVGDWLAQGAAGAPDPWADPADHLVAGLTATLKGGRTLAIRPAPRRAVGPDLIALVVGMDERYARLERVWLRVHPLDAPRPEAHPLVAERNPPLTDDERRLLDAIASALNPPV
jgi:alkyldihydroxyacetonephosphate synthase